jgi:hypothetical protein
MTFVGPAVLASLMVCRPAWADSIIPNDRLYAWGTWCGHRDANFARGGIPRVSAIYTNLGNLDTSGMTDVSAGIQQAIHQCPSNQVVFLPAGTYRLDRQLFCEKDGVVLRGAGVDRTRLVYRGTEDPTVFFVTKTNHEYDFATATAGTLSKDAANGSTNLTLNSNPGWAVGDFVNLDQKTNGLLIAVGSSGDCGFCSARADREYAQLCQIVAMDHQTNLTVLPPIVSGFQTTNNAQAMKAIGMLQKVGFEDFTISNATSVAKAAYTFWFLGTVNCWMTNVDARVSYRRHVYANNSLWLQVQGCRFSLGNGRDWGSPAYDPDRAYSMYLGYGTTCAWIHDNIFEHVHFAISFEGTVSGCAATGNFTTNILFNNRFTAQPSIGFHGAGVNRCLVEGNYAASKFLIDRIWGGGIYGTFFRNRTFNVHTNDGAQVDQYAVCVDMEGMQYFHHLVGNVFGSKLGAAGWEDTVMFPDRGTVTQGSGAQYVYRFGHPNANATTASSFDRMVTNTLILKANYDTRTDGIPRDQSIGATNLAASYFFDAKPASQGFLPWPWFGSDIAYRDNNPTNLAAGYRFYFGSNPPPDRKTR